ncbi:MAG: VWA domain-containing protein [Acidobacteriota bacterium]
MKPQKLRFLMVWVLVVACAASLFPLNLSGAPAAQTAPTQRRSKNGSVSSTPSAKPTAEPTDTEKSPTETDAGKTARANAATAEKAKPESEEQKTGDKENATTAEKTNDSPTPSTRKKREPLPFDRPPVNAPSNTSDKSAPGFDRPASTQQSPNSNPATAQRSTTARPAQPGVEVQKPQTTRTPTRPVETGTRNTPAANPDSDANASTRTTPPVLKRGDDLPSTGGNPNTTPADRQRGAPPVLQRPGQPEQEPVWRSTTRPDAPTSGQPSTNSNTNTGSTQTGDDEVVKLESTMVSIPILASDRSNRYVPQLVKRDFLLYEDGVQQEIAHFGNEEVPFSVALVLDFSPSVQGSQDAIQDAAIDFIRQLRPQDRVMVVAFDRQVEFLTDFTSDRYTLERAIRSTQTGSGTSVYEAVYRTVERMKNVDGRKAMILFSDGEDTTSRSVDYNDAISIVTESDVLVYGLRYPANGGGGNVRVNPWPRNIPNIGLPIPLPFPWPKRRRGPFGNFLPQPNASNAAPQWPRGGGRDFMTDVTNAGGGPVYDAQNIGDMRGLAYKIAEELRHVYMISYYPTNALSNGGYRTIRVRVKNRDDIAVRHRRGYYAKDSHHGSKT